MYTVVYMYSWLKIPTNGGFTIHSIHAYMAWVSPCMGFTTDSPDSDLHDSDLHDSNSTRQPAAAVPALLRKPPAVC